MNLEMVLFNWNSNTQRNGTISVSGKVFLYHPVSVSPTFSKIILRARRMSVTLIS